ncbi:MULTISPECIES: ectoine utilization protein EutA [Burkholderiaceae]|uniref:ectoine utilization protein EutA n=1 Tax=Burkholderiaceae TaxID=119060 RepID=UPI001B94B69E|nr:MULTISPECIES: ectoine utilization protein EutA [Burkholderiaceae]MBR8087564.1 ectoine utilization protein EutA [Burkholderia vietnamiensis]
MNASIQQLNEKPHLDDRAARKRIGLLILSTDHVTELDFARLVPRDGIGVYTTRVPFVNPVTRENLRAMQPSLADGAALILPDEPLDVVMFSCTSASVMIGDDAVKAAVKKTKPEATVVTPTSAAATALQALGAKRISILTPYTAEVSQAMAEYFEAKGFSIDAVTCLGLTDDREMARISHDEIVRLAQSAVASESDALFISCTGVRAAAVIAKIEALIGKPVVSSNLATAWMCTRLCGNEVERPELGRLMAVELPH